MSFTPAEAVGVALGLGPLPPTVVPFASAILKLPKLIVKSRLESLLPIVALGAIFWKKACMRSWLITADVRLPVCWRMKRMTMRAKSVVWASTKTACVTFELELEVEELEDGAAVGAEAPAVEVA